MSDPLRPTARWGCSKLLRSAEFQFQRPAAGAHPPPLVSPPPPHHPPHPQRALHRPPPRPKCSPERRRTPPPPAAPNSRRWRAGACGEERGRILGLISAAAMWDRLGSSPQPAFGITCENCEYPSCVRISEAGGASLGEVSSLMGAESAPWDCSFVYKQLCSGRGREEKG